MNDHPNALLLHQAWQAVSMGDGETVRAIWSEDIVWHVTSDNPWRGDYVGPDAVLEYLASVGESGEAYDTTLKEVLASESYGALICHVSVRRGEVSMEFDQVILGRFEERRIVEVWTISLEPWKVGAFWARVRGEQPAA